MYRCQLHKLPYQISINQKSGTMPAARSMDWLFADVPLTGFDSQDSAGRCEAKEQDGLLTQPRGSRATMVAFTCPGGKPKHQTCICLKVDR